MPGVGCTAGCGCCGSASARLVTTPGVTKARCKATRHNAHSTPVATMVASASAFDGGAKATSTAPVRLTSMSPVVHRDSAGTAYSDGRITIFHFPLSSERSRRGRHETSSSLGCHDRARHHRVTWGNNDRTPGAFTPDRYYEHRCVLETLPQATGPAMPLESVKDAAKVLSWTVVIASATAVNCLRPNRSPRPSGRNLLLKGAEDASSDQHQRRFA